MTTPIPAPPSIPFLGNIASIEKELPLRSYSLLASQYGEIYQLNLPGRKMVVISSYDLVNEVSDDKRFRKSISPSLLEVRNAAGDGLFTAFAPGEPNWYIAHRILMPAFGATNVRGMFDDMSDIISQMMLKWERFGPAHAIDPASDFVRLALDAISLCAMSYRLNSFYMEELPPFARALTDFLAESSRRSMRPGIVNSVMRSAYAKYLEDQKTLMSLVDEILQNRKAHPTDKKDLLTTMLTGKDKETGLGISDDNIKKNLLTFLIAGHETTSGMLTFIIYYLLKNPSAMRKLREEIDTKIGGRQMTVDDVHKLPYLIAVMREALRLAPPGPVRSATPIENTTLKDGKYALEKDVTIVVGIIMSHRDPKVWGTDADEFHPERMMDGKFEALPPNAWQPFGYGMRGCIGRPFAWQEVQMVLVAIFQRFDLVLHDPAYTLQIRQTMSIKPKDFYIHAIPRAGKPQLLAVPSCTMLQSNRDSGVVGPASASLVNTNTDDISKQPLYVLYGSNTGSSEAFAQRIASDAASHGFRATIATLDSATEYLPVDGPVIIVTASFEGEPADNAAHFVDWLSSLTGTKLSQVKFAVFGCGNRDWVATYQRIPKLCDQLLADRGATRIVERGEGDAGGGEFFEAFDKWEADLWTALSKAYSTQSVSRESGLKVQTVDSGVTRAVVLRQNDIGFGVVVENKLLTAPGVPAKRHIEFQLPEGTTYRAGDYLAILPVNPPRDVQRTIAHFGLSAEQEVTISSTGPTSLPVNKPITLFTLLSGYVELSQPATTRDVKILLEAQNSETSRKALHELSAAYTEKVISKRLSVLDILEDNGDIQLSLETFLQMVPPMRIRQYSISSSPLSNAQHVTLTVSILDAPAISGRSEPFLGVASTYLAGLRPGDKLQMAVRASNVAFHLPSDPSVPLIMFCAGSGLAPMRGFLQERALQKSSGRDVGKSLLFFGCRSPKEDYLYSDSDLKEWTELGIVDVKPAFSKASDDSSGCKYVQDRVWYERTELIKAYEASGKFYVCGSGKVAAAVKEQLVNIIQELKQVDEAEAQGIFAKILNGRFATDVFE